MRSSLLARSAAWITAINPVNPVDRAGESVVVPSVQFRTLARSVLYYAEHSARRRPPNSYSRQRASTVKAAEGITGRVARCSFVGWAGRRSLDYVSLLDRSSIQG